MGVPDTVDLALGEVTLGARRWPGSSRRPVLCVHGLSSNAMIWDEVAAALAADGHPVLAVDLRGHGASAAVATLGDDPTTTAAADLAAVCERLGWRSVLVAGQSWGGNVALQLAADHPDLVHGLALVDGGWLHLADRWNSLDGAWAVLAPPPLNGMRADALRARLVATHPDWSPQAIAATLGNLEHLPDGSVRPWLSRERHKAIVASMLAHQPRRLYPRIRCRCLLLAAGDGPNPLAEEALAALPAGSALQRFPGGDHDLHAQRPDRVAAAIGSLR